MKKLFVIAFLMIILGSLSAQNFAGKNKYFPVDINRQFQSSDTVKILAVMVEFQTDHDPNTFGNGKFGSIYSQIYGDTILDPLPFDATYFSNHLEFAKNYFKKVSNGKLNIVYQVLPQIITVSDSMRNYSAPPQSAGDFSNEAKFAREVWQKAAATFTSVDFSKYNLFTIFHAGVGREVAKNSSTGNDRDLLSIYFGLNAFKKIYGNDFLGISTNNGKFLITNTIIQSCTESYEYTSNNTKYLAQSTINAFLVGNVASYIGMPDLFNTSSSITAIGRFGLMDGESLLGYGGLFPPEPSAWEKIYMGWVQPTVLSVGAKKINIAAHLAAAGSDTTILKIPINSTEYFLVENRQRDVNKTGLVLTSKLHGQTLTFQIDKDKGKFQPDIVDTLYGVITDVNQYDWAVPGNGIVIWHIDESIINANIANDAINADSKNRGIYVEEADGVQDIGLYYKTILGQDYGRGEELDMWYAGNQGQYFKNIFGPDSKPNTNSNSGANSLITMQNFSAPANKMSFNISFGTNLKLVSISSLNLGTAKKIFASNGFSTTAAIFVCENSTLYKYDIKGNLVKPIPNFSEIQPAVLDYNGNEYVLGAKGQILNIYSFNSTKDTLITLDILANISAIAADKAATIPKILIGTVNGDAYLVQLDVLGGLNQFTPANYSIYKGDNSIINFGIDNSYYAILQQNKLKLDVVYTLSGNAKKTVLTKDAAGKYTAVVLGDGNVFSIYGALNTSFKINSQSVINDFSVADLFNDGQNYILVSNGGSLEAYNFRGAMANHFPFIGTAGESFIGSPLAADINGDGFTEVIGFTDKGNIYSINARTGKLTDGFPLSSGSQIAATPTLFGEQLPTAGPIPVYTQYLSVLDVTNRLYVWNLSNSQGKAFWSGALGDAVNSSFVAAPVATQKIADFFPTDKAYNWPNPVYGSETKIRYYVAEDANIQIKIFDLAGGLVAELSDQAHGGFDNETIWNVAKIQSGVYYAHIEVNGVSGRNAFKNIKIAVIK